MKTTSVLMLCLLAACCLGPVARADTFADGVCQITKPALVGGLAVAYYCSKEHGLRDAAKAGEAMVVTYGVANALQHSMVVNGSPRYAHTFPSKRASVAFAAAASLSEVYPKHRWIAYSGAALIGWSTVAAHGHTWPDVLAGTALGLAVGKWTVASRDGFLVGRVFKF